MSSCQAADDDDVEFFANGGPKTRIQQGYIGIGTHQFQFEHR